MESGRCAFHLLAHYISPADSNRVRIHTSGQAAPRLLAYSGFSGSSGMKGFPRVDPPRGCLPQAKKENSLERRNRSPDSRSQKGCGHRPLGRTEMRLFPLVSKSHLNFPTPFKSAIFSSAPQNSPKSTVEEALFGKRGTI